MTEEGSSHTGSRVDGPDGQPTTDPSRDEPLGRPSHPPGSWKEWHRAARILRGVACLLPSPGGRGSLMAEMSSKPVIVAVAAGATVAAAKFTAAAFTGSAS